VQLYSSASNSIKIETSGIGIQLKLRSMVLIVGNNPNMICGGGDFSVDWGQTTHNMSEFVGSHPVFSNISHGTMMK